MALATTELVSHERSAEAKGHDHINDSDLVSCLSHVPGTVAWASLILSQLILTTTICGWQHCYPHSVNEESIKEILRDLPKFVLSKVAELEFKIRTISASKCVTSMVGVVRLYESGLERLKEVCTEAGGRKSAKKIRVRHVDKGHRRVCVGVSWLLYSGNRIHPHWFKQKGICCSVLFSLQNFQNCLKSCLIATNSWITQPGEMTKQNPRLFQRKPTAAIVGYPETMMLGLELFSQPLQKNQSLSYHPLLDCPAFHGHWPSCSPFLPSLM